MQRLIDLGVSFLIDQMFEFLQKIIFQSFIFKYVVVDGLKSRGLAEIHKEEKDQETSTEGGERDSVMPFLNFSRRCVLISRFFTLRGPTGG